MSIQNLTQRKYYSLNRDKILKQKSDYDKKNREQILLKKKADYQLKREIKLQKAKIHGAKPETKLLKNNYMKLLRRTNINFAIATRLRSRINESLKGISKSENTLKLLGCSISELKYHLEFKFYPHPKTGEQMTWDNRSRWHIDHVKPCSKFNLKNSEEQKECFHWTNLQPLWAIDNLSKGNK